MAASLAPLTAATPADRPGVPGPPRPCPGTTGLWQPVELHGALHGHVPAQVRELHLNQLPGVEGPMPIPEGTQTSCLQRTLTGQLRGQQVTQKIHQALLARLAGIRAAQLLAVSLLPRAAPRLDTATLTPGTSWGKAKGCPQVCPPGHIPRALPSSRCHPLLQAALERSVPGLHRARQALWPP